jgi:hypothetical protein
VKNKLVTASAVLVFLSAFLFAPVRQVAASVAYGDMSIFESHINSTDIGLTTPAVANFLGLSATTVTAGSVQANGSPAVPLATQGAYLGWSRNGLGEADFFAQNGTGVGGFAWFNTGAATQLMSLNQAGVLTVATVDANLNGNVTGNLIGNGTGTWNGPVNGNASSATVAASTTGNSATATLAASATQLAATPTNCGSGVSAFGIAANGNALCNSSTALSQAAIITSGICTTASAGANCTIGPISWSKSFADTNYALSCTAAPPGGDLAVYVFAQNKTVSNFELVLVQGQGNSASSSGVTTPEIDCTGIHQ